MGSGSTLDALINRDTTRGREGGGVKQSTAAAWQQQQHQPELQQQKTGPMPTPTEEKQPLQRFFSPALDADVKVVYPALGEMSL